MKHSIFSLVCITATTRAVCPALHVLPRYTTLDLRQTTDLRSKWWLDASTTHGPEHNGHPQLRLLEEEIHEGRQHPHLLGQVVRIDLEVHEAFDPFRVVAESPVVLRLSRHGSMSKKAGSSRDILESRKLLLQNRRPWAGTSRPWKANKARSCFQNAGEILDAAIQWRLKWSRVWRCYSDAGHEAHIRSFLSVHLRDPST